MISYVVTYSIQVTKYFLLFSFELKDSMTLSSYHIVKNLGGKIMAKCNPFAQAFSANIANEAHGHAVCVMNVQPVAPKHCMKRSVNLYYE